MSESINPTQGGQPISADAINRLGAEVDARTPVRMGNAHVQQRSGGTVVARKPSWAQPVPRRGAASSHPFKVIDASTATPAAKVRVIFGQVNSLTPTMSADDLDTDPAPTLTVITGVVYLEITLVDGVATAVEVLNAASLPASDSTHGYITLATVTVVSNAVTAINQSVTNSLQYLRCNDQDIFGAV